MRVLLSAYACEPNKGSEPEVGWQRALHMLSIADEVWVLTRSNNRSVIEADPLSHSAGLHFIYYDLSKWALRLKKHFWFLPIYFVLWQWGAYRLAARHHHENPFHRVYHVTFASMQFGSFMGRLGIPFVIGPVAGGERASFRLRKSMPIRGKICELLRDMGIVFQRFNPLSRAAFSSAEQIFVTTPSSLQLISPKWKSKTQVQLAIAIDNQADQNTEPRQMTSIRFVYAGRLLHWKGVHFAIRALAEARNTLPSASLTVIGTGPYERWLRDVAEEFGVTEAVEFAGPLPRQHLIDSLRSYTALVFPSLHDSGGFIVIEALSKGLPVISLDLGGPGIMVNESCGIVVPAVSADIMQTVAGVANAMISLATMSATESTQLSKGAVVRANELSWTKLTTRIAAC